MSARLVQLSFTWGFLLLSGAAFAGDPARNNGDDHGDPLLSVGCSGTFTATIAYKGSPTIAKPDYTTIAEALLSASTGKWCAADLTLDGGEYVGDLAVGKPTTFRAAAGTTATIRGVVTTTGGATVRLVDVTVVKK